MPKIVDHDARRDEIGWVVARMIEQEGPHGVSVRSVAATAGYQPSTLRHYFPSADEMFAHALTLVARRQRRRVEALDVPQEQFAAFRQAWLQALPVDAERRTEAHVWLAASLAARSDAARQTLAAIDAGLDELCRATVAVLSPDADQDAAAVQLRAFTDGLTVGAITRPTRFTPAQVEASLERYLRALQL